MRVVVKNFQSIESAKLDLQGFTVITGKSSIGKTALIRAATAGLFGMPGDHFVRHNTVQCGVGLAEDTNFTIKWYKVKNGQAQPGRETALEINGVKHTKMGRDHATLTEPLGIKEIRTSTNLRIRPQVAMQHDPVFLLAESETVSAEILRMIGRADVVSEAQRNAKKDHKELETRAKIRKEDAAKTEKELEVLDFVPNLRATFDSMEAAVNLHQTSIEAKTKLLEKITKFESLEATPLPPALSIQTPIQLEVGEKLNQWSRLKEQKIPELTQVVEPTELEMKLTNLQTYQNLSNDLNVQVRDLQTLEREIQQSIQDKVGLESDLGTCPTCERSFT